MVPGFVLNKVKVFLISPFFLFFAVFSLQFISCENPFMEKLFDVRTISFNANGGSPAPAVQKLFDGEPVSRPRDPEKEGSLFLGWFDNDDEEWDFNAIPLASMTLNAKWNTFDISLSPSGDIDFGIEIVNSGYDLPPAEIAVSIGGSSPETGDLTISLSGDNPGSFYLMAYDFSIHEQINISSLPPSSAASFKVAVKQDLPIGNYSAVVTITNNANLVIKFNVSFKVVIAASVWVDHNTVSGTYSYGLTLGDMPLSQGYTWNEPETLLNAGLNQPFEATFTEEGYKPVEGIIYVDVDPAVITSVAVTVDAPVIGGTPAVTASIVTVPADAAIIYGVYWNKISDNSWDSSDLFEAGDYEYSVVVLCANTNYTLIDPYTGTATINGNTAEKGIQTSHIQINISRQFTLKNIPEMVQISAGTLAWPNAIITLSAFKMGKYEVTQEQYQDVMGINPSYFNGGPTGGGDSFLREPAAGETQGKRPVENVSWYDAIVFCNRLSILESLTPAYSINGSTNPVDWGTVPTDSDATWDAVVIVAGSTGYRLPTEAQWEYACRAGTTTNFSFGDDENQLGDYAWYIENSSSMTHEVGKKLPNAYGLYDMYGNVFEWCWDWVGDLPITNQTDYEGAGSVNTRVLRGGGWYNSAVSTHSSNRSYVGYPYSGTHRIGFRVVRP